MPQPVRRELEHWLSRVGTPNDQVLARYRVGGETVVDVLRVEDVELSAQGDVLLHVATPEIMKTRCGSDGVGELHQEQLAFTRRFAIPVNRLQEIRPILLRRDDVDQYRMALVTEQFLMSR